MAPTPTPTKKKKGEGQAIKESPERHRPRKIDRKPSPTKPTSTQITGTHLSKLGAKVQKAKNEAEKTAVALKQGTASCEQKGIADAQFAKALQELNDGHVATAQAIRDSFVKFDFDVLVKETIVLYLTTSAKATPAERKDAVVELEQAKSAAARARVENPNGLPPPPPAPIPPFGFVSPDGEVEGFEDGDSATITDKGKAPIKRVGQSGKTDAEASISLGNAQQSSTNKNGKKPRKLEIRNQEKDQRKIAVQNAASQRGSRKSAASGRELKGSNQAGFQSSSGSPAGGPSAADWRSNTRSPQQVQKDKAWADTTIQGLADVKLGPYDRRHKIGVSAPPSSETSNDKDSVESMTPAGQAVPDVVKPGLIEIVRRPSLPLRHPADPRPPPIAMRRAPGGYVERHGDPKTVIDEAYQNETLSKLEAERGESCGVLMMLERQASTFGYGDSFLVENGSTVRITNRGDALRPTNAQFKTKHLSYYGEDIKYVGTTGAFTCLGVYVALRGNRVFCGHINMWLNLKRHFVGVHELDWDKENDRELCATISTRAREK